MSPNSSLMIHDVSSGYSGKNEEIKANAKQTDILQKRVFKMMSKNCGHASNYFLDILHEKAHAEWYLTAKEAKKHNIINHVRVPSYKVNISLNFNFE